MTERARQPRTYRTAGSLLARAYGGGVAGGGIAGGGVVAGAAAAGAASSFSTSAATSFSSPGLYPSRTVTMRPLREMRTLSGIDFLGSYRLAMRESSSVTTG